MTQNHPSLSTGRTWGLGEIFNYLFMLSLGSNPFFSFVVSNVGEFSRTILGSHFKHNNVSGMLISRSAHQLIIHAVLQFCAPAKHVRLPQD